MDYNYDYSDAPNIVRNFLNYKLTIQGRSSILILYLANLLNSLMKPSSFLVACSGFHMYNIFCL